MQAWPAICPLPLVSLGVAIHGSLISVMSVQVSAPSVRFRPSLWLPVPYIV